MDDRERIAQEYDRVQALRQQERLEELKTSPSAASVYDKEPTQLEQKSGSSKPAFEAATNQRQQPAPEQAPTEQPRQQEKTMVEKDAHTPELTPEGSMRSEPDRKSYNSRLAQEYEREQEEIKEAEERAAAFEARKEQALDDRENDQERGD